ncbi:MAG TPA: hypothetical protein VFL79_07700 [Terriglobia bacterium]|nr:hypothetical protein [Terriglobia bacterium]
MGNFLASLAARFSRLTDGTKLIVAISIIVIFLGIIVKAQTSNAVDQSINGEWQCISHGTEDVNVPFTLHLQGSSGRITGWAPDSSVSIPLTSVSYSQGRLSIELDTNAGQYALTAVVSGDRLSGTWKKNGQQVGTWEGQKSSGTEAAAQPARSPFKAISTLDVPTIQGRPVDLDSKGMLLPWPRPRHTGYSYAGYFMSRWQYLWEQYNHQRYYDFYCCIDYDRETFATYPIRDWANSTGYLRAMMEGFIEHLYPYTGDPRTIQFLEDFFDYELENGITPDDYVWGGVPRASADPGAQRYTGWFRHGIDYIEPPVVGEDGYAYLRLFEMTGKARYLQEAIRCANALARNYKEGNAEISPWPYRCFARDGKVEGKELGPYSADVIEPIELFDELIRLNFGDVAAYRRVRSGAWQWLEQYPMKNNVWVGYFEDVTPSMENMNSVIPLETARYAILNPDKDSGWRQDAARLIKWVKTTPKWPKFIVHGATITTEQGNGNTYCCQEPGWCCDSHTSRLAAIEALYFAKTGDEDYKEQAYRSFNWVTYFQGFPPKGRTPWGQNQWWFTDEFADGPRRMMDGLWAVPTWAPADESHLLGTTSVVTSISYGKGSVTYSTFDPAATDVLRLDFTPASVTADGHALAQSERLNQEGYTFNPNTGVLRIRHDHSRDVDIEGEGGSTPPVVVDFDNPHLPANTVLEGLYPAGAINWGDGGDWKIGVPRGRVATFCLRIAKSKLTQAGFAFYYPRVFVGVDVYNSSNSDVTLKVHSPHNADVLFTIPAGKLERLRTGWADRTARVSFETENGATLDDLTFDDLAYTEDSPVTPGSFAATMP